MIKLNIDIQPKHLTDICAFLEGLGYSVEGELISRKSEKEFMLKQCKVCGKTRGNIKYGKCQACRSTLKMEKDKGGLADE